MSKIWLDISHVLGWQGVLSGIERVEYHLINHYFLHTDAGFIAWDKNSFNFYEVDRREVSEKIIKRTSELEVRTGGTAGSSISPIHRIVKKFKKSSKVDTKAWRGEGRLLILAGLWDDKGYTAELVKIADKNSLVHVVYDMIPLIQPNFVVDYLPDVFSEYMLAVLPKCQQIMAISEATKEDVTKVLKENNLAVPKVLSFRLGDDITRSMKPLRPTGVPDNFILSVGTVEARKNHQLLYYVYKRAKEKGIKLPPLIIAGRRGWLTGDFQYVAEYDPDIKNQIGIIDNVSDSEIHWLYTNSMLTVFPSFYEGWGLPVAESLGYGKVTLASDKSSIPEVGGDNVDYFSPYSVDEPLSLISKYINPTQRLKKEEFIKRNYKRLEWRDSAALFATKIPIH